MQNKVGQTNPTTKQIQDIMNQLDQIDVTSEPFTTFLSTEERKAALKFRPGGEKIVALIAELAATYNTSLHGISIADMKADLQLSQDLAPMASKLEMLSQRVSGTVLEAQSECWYAATAYYTALARIASSDPKLQAALKPVVDFFATGRRRAKPADETKSTDSSK